VLNYFLLLITTLGCKQQILQYLILAQLEVLIVL